ncbi:MAG: hypothetical protein AAGB31_15850 [Bdellovibrio sp.]
MTKTKEQLAEAYATGNHRTSMTDMYDKKAFLAGYKAAEEQNRELMLELETFFEDFLSGVNRIAYSMDQADELLQKLRDREGVDGK